MYRYNARLVASLILALVARPVLAITIPTVSVGDLGNQNDPGTGSLYGGVGYAYGIGSTEVTVGQYTAFLNAVANTDTYSLYNSHMATNGNVAGIAQSGSPGTYTYSVIGSPNHPVTYVSWGDSARFANWLHNGQPTGAQAGSTTEDGAYTLNGATSGFALLAVTRNAGAKWFIPTENEWYKGAYYQPAAQGGDSDSYWSYPMKTNSVPYSDQPPGATPDNTRVANFLQDDGVADGYDDGYAVTGSTTLSSSQNYLTDVGAYTSSASYYGTLDQAGSVWEWNETTVLVAAGHFPIFGRGVRGGAWDGGSILLPASLRDKADPTLENQVVGFRVAVPEPTSLTLCLAGIVALALRRIRAQGSRTEKPGGRD
jgi:sulfatase modifying factor 1